jgi:osmotically-inducible protein OsmY
LRGKVESDQQKIRAAKIAHKISGVKDVNNELVVVGKGNR